MPGGRYEITKNPDGTCFFRLLTVSGKAIAHSGTYSCVSVCKKGIASFRVNSDAPLDDRTENADANVQTSNAENVGKEARNDGKEAQKDTRNVGKEVRGEENCAPMKCPKIELFSEKNAVGYGSYNFVLRARNGSVIATGEGYGTKKRCLEAIDAIRYIAFSADSYLN